MSEISSETRFLHAIEMGLGAWQWGDRVVWQYGHGYSEEQVHEAFRAAIAEGIQFIDTAELYGSGLSERLLGALHAGDGQARAGRNEIFPLALEIFQEGNPESIERQPGALEAG